MGHQGILLQEEAGNSESSVLRGDWTEAIPKLEIMTGALIMDSTGIGPRGTFAVIQTLGSE